MIFELLLFFPVAVLANWQVLETWRHGSIFTEWRARLEAKPSWFHDLLLCTFCFGHHTGLVIGSVAWIALFNITPETVKYCWLWPLYCLAITRSSQWLNDFFHDSNRTPKLTGLTELNDIAETTDDQRPETPAANSAASD